MKKTDITVNNLLETMEQLGYDVFKGESKPYNLNLISVRSKTKQAGKFDDYHCILYLKDGEWDLIIHTGTTDPGRYYLKNTLSPLGALIMKPDQNKGAWKVGWHKGKYPALVQVKPITVIRDGNRDEILDFDSEVEETGYFGVNMHKHFYRDKSAIQKSSAGCQVRQYNEDQDAFIAICKLAAKQWGNSFSHTLLTEAQLLG